jgi:subtilisin family serine protease
MAGGSWAIARHIRRDAPWRVAPRIRAPIETFFRCARTGAGVDAYVVDSGIREDHAVFGGRVSVVGGTYGTGGVDDHGHGTSVAAVLAGDTVGLARGASLRIVKGLDASNIGTFTAIASAIGLARADFEARAGLGRPAVLNLSLSANGATIDAAVSDCIDAGLIVVASAGNALTGTIGFPAASLDVICVGGITANDTPYYTGSFGTASGARVDILAGAERIWTASFTASDAFRLGSGTSYAAPLVAGALACMLQGRPRPASRTNVQAVRDALLGAATTGRFQPQPQFPTGDLPDRILWLDPDATDVPIPGLG